MTTPFAERTPQYYLDRLDPGTLASFNEQQLAVIVSLLDAAISKPSPKIIDLRLNIDLIIFRFYIVLFVGKDRRRNKRIYPGSRLTRFANLMAAIFLLLMLNMALSAFIFLTAYLLKSALGINLFPENFQEMIR